MASLSGKTVLVVGGSSGIGYGVAKASLLSCAAKVTIGSSSQAKIESALVRIKNDIAASGQTVEGNLSGEVVDARDSASVKALLERVGEVDHLVWTSGDDFFDVRFWGAFTAAQVAKIRPGGSITLTVGSVVVKPRKGWSLAAGLMGAVDSLTRGLAVDLAPIRVNVISPGAVKTELWDPMPPEVRNKIFEDSAKTLLVQHVAEPDEIAEAYLFCMKCQYITGQRIEVDGGAKYV
ncbi:NAD-binding protein [Sanghuangporus baumii]|uniref:NAD-binding protein n=1 Tax=Sanghuangporus baumii TaxID=108892 RepID=A0A9Q5HUA2_SANBA|nr:NAD-binding protein [Sanghuangporus baumii]